MNNPFLNPNINFFKQQHPDSQKKLASWYLKSSINKYQDDLRRTNEQSWQKKGRQKALHLFHQAAKYVPAYRDFLRNHGIKPSSIKSYRDFIKIPCTTKQTYFAKYDLPELAWNGKLATANTISFSSGSTGKPFFWPRGTYQDYEGAFAFEHALTSLFQINQKTTLLVNCFSMGNYVAGVYVYTSAHLLAQKGYPLTIVSPGINYQDTFNIISKTIDKYDQIILCGYPPFLRDILELGESHHIAWHKYKLKFFFASEFFSEKWRDDTLAIAGNRSPLSDSTNIYGTADSAIFAFETPTSIMVRKIASQNSQLQTTLFGLSQMPTFVQYNPLLTFFEIVESEICITSNSGLPLIRYNLKDQGGIISNHQLEKSFAACGLDFKRELEKHQLTSSFYELPHAYITKRTDGAVSFYAILIFPDYIRTGLESPRIEQDVSGKFTIEPGYNKKLEPTITIHVELKPHCKKTSSLKQKIQQEIINGLRKRCAEYSFLEKSIKDKAKPSVILHHKGTSKYFKIGIKQKWILT